PAIVPSKPLDSPLLARLKSGEMPPGEKKVPAEQIAVIERWIAQGAKTAGVEPEQLPAGLGITPEERAFWFFQPLRAVEPPTFGAADRVRTPIDAFVLKQLREKGLSFATDADRRLLLLRAALDLTGLPPTADEMQAFVADVSPQAYEAALDRLLSSPHYGERWGRHWLDVAGYADSDGNGTEDTVRPYAYKYRDYVIRSLNADKPLNQFIVEQLAGDELVPLPWANLTPAQIELLTATGYLRTAVDGTRGAAIPAEAANLVVADTLKIVSTSLLGLTVGCAQCHDHRYDPIPQADYFRLRAIFEPALDPARWRGPTQRLVSLYTDADRALAAQIEGEVSGLKQTLDAKTQKFLTETFEKELLKAPEAMRAALREAYNTPGDKRTAEQKQLLAANPSVNLSAGNLYQYDQAAADELKQDGEHIAAVRAKKPVEDFLSVLSEVPGVLPPTHLFHRGDYRQPQQTLLPGDLTIAAPESRQWEPPAKDAALSSSGRRLAYAKHLTSGQHPLLGRVLVNRLWMQHFGRGLVDTPGDFGALGGRPSHPELLDYLALQLPEQGWSLKRMHKAIMLSTVYRQSSQRSREQEAIDNENRLLGHYPLRRLDAEIIRDRMLLGSGRLDRTPFGPAVTVAEDFVGQVLPANDSARRSIYLQARRTKPVSFLTAFDAPVMAVNCEQRVASTTSPQSLMLMNSDFVLTQAAAMAQRLKVETKPDDASDLTAQLAEQFPRASEAWQFGYGAYDEASQRITFAPLPHWTGTAWQGGNALPDPSLGWALLNAGGGHTGDAPSHATIRRWTAHRAGVVAISGKLQHPSENGDGVRARVVSSRSGMAGQWRAQKSEVVTDVAKLEVLAGDTLDFIVDCVGDVNSDSFAWVVDIKLSNNAGELLGGWNSSNNFHGPTSARLPQLVAKAWQLAYVRDANEAELRAACEFLMAQMAHLQQANSAGDHELTALTSLCQQLLSSNEFLYVE
ncbi:MAG TPA: DUF1549 and DUF1553 domain-containing protein, partial [Pirellulaceae bacterium]|nr:DUF1549 and DUF1553 domain-containing protein [Pirellulaceae bacterium]